jgi:Prokaryotic Cytochrome C oxidase subunit IV
LLLMLATVSTFELRTHGVIGVAAGAATLGIAYVKGRLIILDFMELRRAGSLWRGIAEGWVLAISLLIFAIYWFSGTS